MNYKDAIEILEIDLSETCYNEITLDFLKIRYRKLALKNHPDKNGNTLEATIKFQQINEAYHYLNREIKNDDLNTEESDTSSLYLDILKKFMDSVFKGNNIDFLSKIVNEIILAGKKISINLFDNLDRETALNIYSFLSTNHSILHINQEILEIIRNLVVKKYSNVEIYKLNPSINDLLNNNFYKLYLNNELFLVPLWHNESYFDCSDSEIIVICNPELPENIKIDDKNNICFKKEINIINELPELLESNEPIQINIGDKEISIPISNLYLQKEQFYIVKNQGLSKIKKEIYDVSEKTDIIINIILI